VRPAVSVRVEAGANVLRLLRAPTMRHYPNVWANPGGSVEPGEMPLQAAVRELEEETGLVVSPHELRYSHMSIEPPFHVRNYVLRLNRTVEPRLDSEHTAWKWVRTH